MTQPRLPFTVKIVGISHYQHAAQSTRVGDVIVVHHEPTNAFDSHACYIERHGERLGYLPRAISKRLVEGGGTIWTGVVSHVRDAHTTIGIDITITEVVEGGRDVSLTSRPHNHGVDSQTGVVVAKRSGRHLGSFVRENRDQRTIVALLDGNEIAYPDGLVDICANPLHTRDGEQRTS